MSVRRLYRVSDLGKVGPVEGLDASTVLSVSAGLAISFPGGHLDLNDDAHINVDVSVAQEIRDAFSGTSMAEIAVYDSLDVTDATELKELAVQVVMTSGPSWASVTYREQNVETSFELEIRVIAPAERTALLAARTILREALLAVIT